MACQNEKISKHWPVLILKSWQDEVKSYIGSHVANGGVGRGGRDCRGITRGDCVQMELTGAMVGTQSW